VQQAARLHARTDWRFLLPTPDTDAFERLVVLGASDEQAERVRASGLSRRVEFSLAECAQADVVVILTNAVKWMAEAIDALPSGGMLYLEVDRREISHRGATPASITRRLRRHGIRPVAAYWAVPDFERAQVYLPLGAPAAREWYLSVMRRQTPAARLMYSAALRMAERIGRAMLSARLPCFAMLATRGGATGGEPALVSRAASAGGAGNGRRDRPTVMLCSTPDDYGRVVLLPFAQRAPRPVVVVKAARMPARNASILHEQSAMTKMRLALDGRMRDTIPNPLGTLRLGRLSAGVESYAAGRPMESPATGFGSRRRNIDNLRIVTAWLTAMQQQVDYRREPLAPDICQRLIFDPLHRYSQHFGAANQERDLFDLVRHRAATFQTHAVPLVWQHQDLTARNIFRRQREMTVIDWEAGRPALPLRDLLFFLFHWYAALRPEFDEQRIIRALVLDPEIPDRYAGEARSALEMYCTCLRIDPATVPVLHVMMWVERSLGRVDRARLLGVDAPLARIAPNRYTRCVAALAAGRDRLFPQTTSHGQR
jgi:Phosphotransferase enzyme family